MTVRAHRSVQRVGAAGLRVTLLGALLSAQAIAQDSLPPWQGGITQSLGQPPRFKWHTGAAAGGSFNGPAVPVGYAMLGVRKDLMNPVVGLLEGSVEAYAGFRGDLADGGVRALLGSTTLRLSGGIDYNIRDGRPSPFLGLTMPVRRGGVFGSGTLLRLEWWPAPGRALRLGVLAPVAQPRAGRTRPVTSRVHMGVQPLSSRPAPADAQLLDPALDDLARLITRIQLLVVPYIDAPGGDPRQTLAPLIARFLEDPILPGVRPGPGLNTDGVVRAYHAALEHALSIASAGHPIEAGTRTPTGLHLGAYARQSLLEHVILPFDRLLGQPKAGDLLDDLAAHARGTFARAVLTSADAPREREEAILYVFAQVVQAIVATQHDALMAWGDTRVLWIPLQLALRPEEHDTQAELDAIVEQAVGQPFTDGNRVWYVVNEQFQREVSRSIQEAEDYHVLWIHDFRGRNAEGEPDRLSLRYVVDSYLSALTKRVRDYDVRGRLPLYMILLDQHYYEVNKGRLWLDFLERPLGDVPRLPHGFEEFEERLRAAQSELREAVANSRLLEREARQYGQRWLQNQVKVHVSITNPADPSFWSRDIVPLIGIPDNVMRDHRKIAFYDITEEDAYRCFAIYTGMGIGEHYAGPTWEDRAIMAQGPAVITLKAAVRDVFVAHGFAAHEIPYALRPRPRPANYDALVEQEIANEIAAGGASQRAMELHNGTGFADKPVNVAKAVLYTLMPPGSVVKVPDSLWGSAIYASLLVGSALRGARVLIIAPSLEAAPSSGWPAMALAHDLFGRLIVLQQELGPELAAAGGLLRTGIYNPGVGVQDVLQRFIAAYQNARRTPFLRRLFPVDESVDTALVRLGFQPTEVTATWPADEPVDSVVPKLHLKANFFASREGWDQLVASPEVADVILAYINQLVRARDDARRVAEALRDASLRLIERFRARLSPAERDRLVYYLIVGSANQDYRSMFMDGEASVLISGWSGIVGLIDFGLLVNLSVWVDDLAMLDQLLPPPSSFQRSLARRLRPAL